MKSKASFLFPLVLAAPLSAQYFTSPTGFLNKEGATNHGYILFSEYEMRWQACDRSRVGGGTKVINSVAWRRDFGSSNSTSYAGRTLTNFEMILADADFATIQNADLDKNYKGTPTTVINKRTVKAADWTQKPASSPAPWSNVLKFDRPFIARGKDAMIWEVRYTANTSTTNYPFDFEYVGSSSGYNSVSGTNVGTACTASGQTSSITLYITFYNHGTKFRIYRSVYRMPAGGAVLLNIDALDRKLKIPGMCSTIHALPTILVNLGLASSSGSISGTSIDNLPHMANLIGKELWFQAWAIDLKQPNLPFVFSQAEKVVVPADPKPTQVLRNYHYKASANGSLIKSGPWTGGIITRFGP